jgi:hypothetical protein
MTRRNAGAGMFGRYSRLFPLRRSLSSQRIATGQKRHTDAECTKCPNASHPRCRRRTHFAALPAYGFAAERRPRIREIPTAIQWQHEESRIVNPMIPDLAATAQRFSAAQQTHPHVARSDRTPSPDRACAARREWPSQFHRNGASLLATDATSPTAWRRGSTRPDHRMRGWNRMLPRATIETRPDAAESNAVHAPTKCHASVNSAKPDLANATSGSRHHRTFIYVGRARIARQT